MEAPREMQRTVLAAPWFAIGAVMLAEGQVLAGERMDRVDLCNGQPGVARSAAPVNDLCTHHLTPHNPTFASGGGAHTGAP